MTLHEELENRLAKISKAAADATYSQFERMLEELADVAFSQHRVCKDCGETNCLTME